MTREIILTADGSHTITIAGTGLTYASKWGAIAESRHVFIEAGLRPILSRFPLVADEPIRIFEMGFGTGLNALLSFEAATAVHQPIIYTAVELHPLSMDEAASLNYPSLLGNERLAAVFSLLHVSPWNIAVAIAPFFTLHKLATSLLEMKVTDPFHLIYFDAFAPDAQPELWTADVFTTLYNSLHNGGVLVTYCSKGSVRRALQAVGFVVEKLAGPKGKREMIRAVKMTQKITGIRVE